MSKKNYAVTIAGGGSTFTPGIAIASKMLV